MNSKRGFDVNEDEESRRRKDAVTMTNLKL